MAETFGPRLKSIREAKTQPNGRPMSQEEAARRFDVSLSCWRNWEANPPRRYPDPRSMRRFHELWPEVFQPIDGLEAIQRLQGRQNTA